MLHFTQGEFVAKGGGGKRFKSLAYDWEIRNRAGDAPLAVKIVAESLQQMLQYMGILSLCFVFWELTNLGLS